MNTAAEPLGGMRPASPEVPRVNAAHQWTVCFLLHLGTAGLCILHQVHSQELFFWVRKNIIKIFIYRVLVKAQWCRVVGEHTGSEQCQQQARQQGGDIIYPGTGTNLHQVCTETPVSGWQHWALQGRLFPVPKRQVQVFYLLSNSHEHRTTGDLHESPPRISIGQVTNAHSAWDGTDSLVGWRTGATSIRMYSQ